MATITVTDPSAQGTIEIGDPTPLSELQLLRLAVTGEFIKDLKTTLDQVQFDFATLGVTFPAPTISIDHGPSLTVTAGINGKLTMYRTGNSPLLGIDVTVPDIAIGANEYWLSFELDTMLDIYAAGRASGFGVSVDHSVAVAMTGYKLFDQPVQFEDAVRATLENFAPLCSAGAARNQKAGTVLVADTSGSVTVSGSYSLPLSINQLSLGEATAPFKIDLEPHVGVTLTGVVSLTGDYSVRSWRKSANELILGVFKQRGTTWSASLNVGAGLRADLGSKDLIETFFSAVAPKLDLTKSGLTKDDPNYWAINATLKRSIDRNLAISTNASCAATFETESAVVYSIDLTGNQIDTDKAIDAALHGDWTALPKLPNVKELKNVVGNSREAKATLNVNLLGIFNYEAIEDFVRSSMVLHSDEDGSITITDRATASRITVASMPYAADPDKLRRILDQSMIATAVYTAANQKFNAALTTNQSLVVYKDVTGKADLEKLLRLGPAIGIQAAVTIDNPKPRHVLIEASQKITGAQAENMFFSNTAERVPWDLNELTLMGRRTLANLLDPADSVDATRIRILLDDGAWQQMDNQQFPRSTSPASYSDWYDVTFWANAVHNAGGPLRDVLNAIDEMPAGEDPSTNADFTRKRQALAKALASVVKDSNAAFEKGWSIAVTYALAGGGTNPSLSARWDGVQRIGPAVAAVRAGHG
jgi:hypothetical protein